MRSVSKLVKVLAWQILGWGILLALPVMFLAVTNINGSRSSMGDPTETPILISGISAVLAGALIGLYLLAKAFGESGEDALTFYVFVGANAMFSLAGLMSLAALAG